MKIELELPDKPEVHAIAGMLNIDPDSVVGKLIRIWQWFDKHTVNGNAYGVTYSLPDRISGVIGFGEAMSFVGWLEQQDKTLVMPRFDRHTSASAKARALTAKRVSVHKLKSNADSNATTNATTVSESLPREEKRRIKDIGDKPPKPSKGSKVPKDFYPDETGVRLASELDVSIPAEIGQFTDHHTARGTVMKDWQAAWRTWARNAHKFAKNKSGVESDFSDVIR